MQSSPWPWNNDNPNPFDAIQKVSLDFSVEVIKDQHQKSRDFVNLFFQNHLSSLSWCSVFAPAARTEFYTSDLNSWYTFGVHEPNLMLYVAVCMWGKGLGSYFWRLQIDLELSPLFTAALKYVKMMQYYFFFTNSK